MQLDPVAFALGLAGVKDDGVVGVADERVVGVRPPGGEAALAGRFLLRRHLPLAVLRFAERDVVCLDVELFADVDDAVRPATGLEELLVDRDEVHRALLDLDAVLGAVEADGLGGVHLEALLRENVGFLPGS